MYLVEQGLDEPWAGSAISLVDHRFVRPLAGLANWAGHFLFWPWAKVTMGGLTVCWAGHGLC
jgi:hypothetical protein